MVALAVWTIAGEKRPMSVGAPPMGMSQQSMPQQNMGMPQQAPRPPQGVPGGTSSKKLPTTRVVLLKVTKVAPQLCTVND
jgi:hypothetical protein